MKISGDWLRRQIACSLMVLLTAPFGIAATTRQQAAAPDGSGSSAPASATVPESQGADTGADTNANPPTEPTADAPVPPTSLDVPPAGAPDARSLQPANQNPPAANTMPVTGATSAPVEPAADSEPAPIYPVGTAAAPYTKTTGFAASRPAGAVIAPAKQKRARSILIRVGVIVGAVIAVGTVAALTTSGASHSRP